MSVENLEFTLSVINEKDYIYKVYFTMLRLLMALFTRIYSVLGYVYITC